MDGFAVLETLRANEHWRSISVIVVTAKDLSRKERKLLRGRAEGILQKGAYRRQQLVDMVRKRLEAVE